MYVWPCRQLVVAFIMHEARAEYPLIHLSVLARPNIAVAALLILIYPDFGTTGASFVLPDYLTRVQGLRALQIGDALNWIALPQFVLVPLVALLLKRIDARLLLVFGSTMLAIGSWIETGLTHDWVGGDFMVSQIDAFWLIAWVSLLGILLVLLLCPPPPNPLIPSRGGT